MSVGRFLQSLMAILLVVGILGCGPQSSVPNVEPEPDVGLRPEQEEQAAALSPEQQAIAEL